MSEYHQSSSKNQIRQKMDSLGEGKRQVLLKMLRERASSGKKDVDEHTIPLSLAQQRVWFEHQNIERPEAYNVYSVVKVEGNFNINQFQYALGLVVMNQPILRSRIRFSENGLYHDIKPNLELDEYMCCYKLTKQDDVMTLIRQYIAQPFELRNGPLFRCCIYQYEATNYIIFCFHHIIMDAVSIEFLKENLIAYYQNSTPNVQSDYDYFDYVKQEQILRNSKRYIDQRFFWKQYLDGCQRNINLPYDYTSFIQTDNGNCRYEKFVIDYNLYQGIARFIDKQQLTPYVLYLSVWALVLYKYSGDTDFAIGSAVANRTETYFARSIGFFVNTILVRNQISADDTLIRYLQKQQHNILTCLEAQQVNLTDVAHDIEDYNPYQSLFNVFYNFTDKKNLDFQLPGVNSQVIDVLPVDGAAKFDLSLELAAYNDKLEGFFEYRTDLFNKATIVRLKNSFLKVLGFLVYESFWSTSLKALNIFEDNTLDYYL